MASGGSQTDGSRGFSMTPSSFMQRMMLHDVDQRGLEWSHMMPDFNLVPLDWSNLGECLPTRPPGLQCECCKMRTSGPRVEIQKFRVFFSCRVLFIDVMVTHFLTSSAPLDPSIVILVTTPCNAMLLSMLPDDGMALAFVLRSSKYSPSPLMGFSMHDG